MQLSITDAANALGVSTNTVRRRLTNGLLTGNKVGNQWVINVPDEAETAPGHALASGTEALASGTEALASGTEALASGTEALASRELIDQLKADLANATDRITFLEGHISQLTHALGPGQAPEAAAGQAPKPASTHKSLLEHVRDWYWRR